MSEKKNTIHHKCTQRWGLDNANKIALYGAKSCIILKADNRRIESFETWLYRMVLKKGCQTLRDL